jgi:hypothetical protein
MKRLLVLVALVVAGCSNGGTVAPENLPPAGTIWFGTSFDTTTFALSGQAASFGAGAQVALVAHLSAKVPEGQATTLVFDSYPVPTAAAPSGGMDVYGWVIPSVLLTVGEHTVTIRDVGGNVLASGTVRIAG